MNESLQNKINESYRYEAKIFFDENAKLTKKEKERLSVLNKEINEGLEFWIE